MKKPIRMYYERTNYLIQHYLYIDRLLDSSLPHDLLQDYQQAHPGNNFSPSDVPATITEEPTAVGEPQANGAHRESTGDATNGTAHRIKRTPKDIYRIKQLDESTPLLKKPSNEGDEEQQLMPPDLEEDEESGSQSRIVTVAIYVNLAANFVLLVMKIIVVALSSSVSVLASLVDAALDFLSTGIVWTTTRLVAHNDQYLSLIHI